MRSSAIPGIPGSPRAVDTAPSCITPPRVSGRSWACWMIGRSNIAEYSSALRMISASCTGSPSSENRPPPPRRAPPGERGAPPSGRQ